MALFEGNIYSHALGGSTPLSVSLPNDTQKRPEQGFPSIYLLHGLFDNYFSWVRNTTIDRYAAAHGFAVVMPDVQRSYYTDMRYGLSYFTYVTDELPKLCSDMFGLSVRREHTFVAGVSMGGYGALKCGLRRPDVFSACAGLSAAVDIQKRAVDYINHPEMRSIFGEPAVVGGEDDLFSLSKNAAVLPADRRPAVFLCCGTEDERINENRSLKSTLDDCGIDVVYSEAQGGHDWDYWEHILPQVIDFFSSRAGNKAASK